MKTKLAKWKPINEMVLVLKDEDKDTTSGGIILPDKSKIPVITCRVLEIGPKVDYDACPIKEYCRVLVKPGSCVPLNLESDNKQFVVRSSDILAYEEMEEEDSYDSGSNFH